MSVEEALSKRVTVRFDAMRLDDVADFLQYYLAADISFDPEVGERLAAQVAAAAGAVRELGLYKPPGVAESIDWARALVLLEADELSLDHVEATLGTLLKYREDIDRVRDHDLPSLVAAAHG